MHSCCEWTGQWFSLCTILVAAKDMDFYANTGSKLEFVSEINLCSRNVGQNLCRIDLRRTHHCVVIVENKTTVYFKGRWCHFELSDNKLILTNIDKKTSNIKIYLT